MSVKHTRDVTGTVIGAGKGTTKQVLISSDEAPNFAMRRFVMQPGGGMPNHTNMVEHEQYVLNGHGRISIGGKIYEVQKGDVVFIPAGIPHWYTNIGNEPFEFLCMVPNKPDKITILGEE